SSAWCLAWPRRPALPRYPSPGWSSPTSCSVRVSIRSATCFPRSEKKLSGSSIAAYRVGSQRAQCCWAVRPYLFMVGSLLWKEVVFEEEGVLDIVARQGTGVGGTAGLAPTLRPGGRAADQAVLEEPLVLLPPALSEQRLPDVLP